MKTTLLGLLAATSFAGTCFAAQLTAVVSPDGRNEIRLFDAPLAYEVLRNGKPIVAKSEIGMKLDGACLAKDAKVKSVKTEKLGGVLETPVYKKAKVCLAGNSAVADFGDWGVRVVARNDGVAYRFETKKAGTITVDCEKAEVAIAEPEATAYQNRNFQAYKGDYFQNSWESVNETVKAKNIFAGKDGLVYLPLVLKYADGTALCITESDLHDYPGWNLRRLEGSKLGGIFAQAAAKLHDEGQARGRQRRVIARENYLTKTAGTRTFPWRTFILAASCSQLCESDLVAALAEKPKGDYSWVKPGKVAWDWWNDWNLQGPHINFKAGCNTKTYEYYIDFAAKTGVEYVIFDEGWSEHLNIWKFHKNVDVPHLIKYAEKKGVGIILWMAWAQVDGMEEKVAEHFGKLGAKGFKVDFMDRDDAGVVRFLDKFAAECAKRQLLVDYHGMYKPTGMEITMPNVLNFEGIHGLEQMKWHRNNYDFMASDVKSFFVRLTAGPMDYTPGAMDNYPVRQCRGNGHNPGSCGTRCRQMAMMSMYFAPLQMLCDTPTKYEQNMECFKVMSETPVVWADTKGLAGDPEQMAACARQAKDGSWYAAAINNETARDYTLDCAFLGAGEWRAEIFRDAEDADTAPTHYKHEFKTVKAGEKLPLHLAKGGGFTIKFTK